jgi:hypothetical protein
MILPIAEKLVRRHALEEGLGLECTWDYINANNITSSPKL